MPRPVVYPITFGALSGTVSASTLDQNFNAAGSVINDSASGWSNVGVDTGTTNNYVVALTPPAAAYTNGFMLSFLPLNPNTGPSSINVNGLGNIQIVGPDGSALSPNTLVPGVLYSMVCVNNAFRIVSQPVATAFSFVGEIKMYTGSTAPFNWLLCDGSTYDRTQYSALFAVCGTAFGAGNGVTTFAVPDMRGRSPIGAGQGPGLTLRTLGQNFGEEAHVLSVPELAAHSHTVIDPGHLHGITQSAHAHSISDPGHAHGVSDPGHAHGYLSPVAGGATSGFNLFGSDNNLKAATDTRLTNVAIQASGTNISVLANNANISVNAAATGITLINAGSSTAHNTVHPVTVVTYIIRAF